MLDLHAWATPNAFKVSIMLEETGLAYNVIPVDITSGGQLAPEFVKISPNGKMPAIVDHDAPNGPLAIFESGAILMYLAEKTGQFWPQAPHARYQAAQWVMWQMAGLGPMMGQAAHFRKYAPDQLPYAIARYTNEVKRLFKVLDKQLEFRDYIAEDYSIADMACYPWTTIATWMDLPLDEFPAVIAWQSRMAARPAVTKGMALLAK